MTITLIIVACALLALLFLMRLAKGRTDEVHSAAELRAQLRPVDVQAFRNLTDPEEEEFLQSSLTPAKFRTVQRQRLQASLAYVLGVANNAAVLARMGEAARRSSDPSVAEAGQKLVDSSIRLRLYALRAAGKLYLNMVFPGRRTVPEGLVENYERMTRQGLLLGRMQYPARGVSPTL